MRSRLFVMMSRKKGDIYGYTDINESERSSDLCRF